MTDLPPGSTTPAARERLSIAFATRSVPMDGDTPWARSLGGSESAMVFMARALAARGHHVEVFTRCSRPGEYDDVVYHDVEGLREAALANEWDVFVSLRFPDLLVQDVRAHLKVLWCQDVLSRHATDLPGLIPHLDRFLFVSRWHRDDTVRALPQIAPMSWITRNPIPLDRVPPPSKKDPGERYVVHLSRPERGLGPLLEAWPAIRRRCPEVGLRAARYVSFHEPRGGTVEAFCLLMDQRVRETEGARHVGHLSKPALYDLLARADLLVYPADFDETSCIAAIEAQACGVPVVATRRGALPETVADGAGILVDGRPSDAGFSSRFADAVVELLYDGPARAAMGLVGRDHAGAYDATVVAVEWEDMFLSFLEERAKRRRDAVVATLEARAGTGRSPAMPPCRARWPGIREGLVSALVAPLLECHRVGVLASLAQRDLVAALARGGLRVAAVASPDAIDRLSSIDGVLDLGGLVTALDPVAWLERLAGALPPGTPVTHWLPSGHGDDGTPLPAPRRTDPTYDDLFHWFGEEAAYTVTIESHAPYARPLRCYVVSYSSGALRPTALAPDRKLRLTRPEPRVSVCMIVRDEEQHVLRALHSVLPVAAEIHVIDTGSHDGTVEVLTGFARRASVPVHVTSAPWPDDFAAARNLSIEQAAGDWILWIDADEELVGAERLRRYADSELYEAYAIRQHNLIFDRGVTKVEIPQRMFRNGRGYRFYGCIHEHPERSLNEMIEPWLLLEDVHILHTGYLTEPTRLRKSMHRNLALLARDFHAYPGRLLTRVLHLRDCVNLAHLDLRETGTLSSDVRAALSEALADFERRFLWTDDRYARLGREYYDRGLELLGAGRRVRFELTGPDPEQPIRFEHWYRDPEDLLRMLDRAGRAHLHAAGFRWTPEVGS